MPANTRGLTLGLTGLIVFVLLLSSTIGVSSRGPAQPEFIPTAFIYLPLVANNPISNDVLTTEQQIANLINQERAKYGLPPLTLVPALTQSARRHSNDMAQNNFFDHTGSDGSTFDQRITGAGYNWSNSAENIAWWPANNPEAVVQMWMNSDQGHREAILSPTYTEFGVGFAANPASSCENYYTVDFAKPASP